MYLVMQNMISKEGGAVIIGNITWTKSYSASDNGSILGGADLQNIQSDITTVVNGGLSNSNLASDAAVVESKLAFNTSTGHTHNGTDAKSIIVKHYRKGCLIKAGTTAASNIKVTPGVLDIGGTLLVSTADSTDLNLAGADWVNGSEPTDGPVYVYAYNNSGSVGYKLSTEPPDLSDASDNTAEFPLRYQKYSSTYYRLVGIAHNRTDLMADMFNQFDSCPFATGSFTADGNDETVYLGWTPSLVEWVLCSDATPANAEAVDAWGLVQRYSFNTAAPNPQNLYFNRVIATNGPTHATSANGTVNSLYNLNAQTTAQAGSFTLDAPTNTQVVVWWAWSYMGAS